MYFLFLYVWEVSKRLWILQSLGWGWLCCTSSRKWCFFHHNQRAHHSESDTGGMSTLNHPPTHYQYKSIQIRLDLPEPGSAQPQLPYLPYIVFIVFLPREYLWSVLSNLCLYSITVHSDISAQRIGQSKVCALPILYPMQGDFPEQSWPLIWFNFLPR